MSADDTSSEPTQVASAAGNTGTQAPPPQDALGVTGSAYSRDEILEWIRGSGTSPASSDTLRATLGALHFQQDHAMFTQVGSRRLILEALVDTRLNYIKLARGYVEWVGAGEHPQLALLHDLRKQSADTWHTFPDSTSIPDLDIVSDDFVVRAAPAPASAGAVPSGGGGVSAEMLAVQAQLAALVSQQSNLDSSVRTQCVRLLQDINRGQGPIELVPVKLSASEQREASQYDMHPSTPLRDFVRGAAAKQSLFDSPPTQKNFRDAIYCCKIEPEDRARILRGYRCPSIWSNPATLSPADESAMGASGVKKDKVLQERQLRLAKQCLPGLQALSNISALRHTIADTSLQRQDRANQADFLLKELLFDVSNAVHLLSFEISKLTKERDNMLFTAHSVSSSKYHVKKDSADWVRSEDGETGTELVATAAKIRSERKDSAMLRKNFQTPTKPPGGGFTGKGKGQPGKPGQGQSRKARQRRQGKGSPKPNERPKKKPKPSKPAETGGEEDADGSEPETVTVGSKRKKR